MSSFNTVIKGVWLYKLFIKPNCASTTRQFKLKIGSTKLQVNENRNE